MAFKVGDVVRLKSDGPRMTVYKVYSATRIAFGSQLRAK